MKVLYELPEKERSIINELLDGEKLLYCTPYDLSISGELADGWLIITKRNYIIIEDGKLLCNESILNGTDYKLINNVGSGAIEGSFNEEERVIVRFSMTHLPRYTLIARVLEDISKSEMPKVISDNNENNCPKCGRPYAEGTKVCHHCTNKKVIFRRFLALIKPYWLPLALSLPIFWTITGLTLINPMLFRKLIDGYLMKHKTDGFGILFIILGIGACDLARTLLDIIKNRLMTRVGSGISRDLRKTVFAKIHTLSIGYIDSKKTGDLMNRVNGDTGTVQDFISNNAAFGINQILNFIVLTVLLFIMNWRMALLIITPVPFIAYTWIWLRGTFSTMYHTQWKISDKSNSILHDILSGIRVVKAFGMEEKEVNRFSSASRQLAAITARNEKIYNTIFPFLTFIMGLGNFFILYYGGTLILKQHMELGELIQFTQYAGMLYGPLGWLTFFPRALTQAATATERIFEILDEEPEIKDTAETSSLDIKGKVKLNNITFGYKSYDPMLKNITLDVKPGEMIGLVGHSGAGKSTLINLILRLYDVNEGQLLIDGKDIRSIPQKDLRSQIGVVLQETFLFSGTILENIAYAKPDASLEYVIRAAKVANAHDFIMRFPDGYDTRVGEKGQRLSGGERQRIAIARAILHDPKILILDEATASVDTETEYQIQEALGKLVKNRTTFAIAHRLSTLRNATRLLVLDNGKQIELGTHEDLMRSRGKYYSLVMAQREMSRTKGA
jgi:ATP-binding cassette subfamily B protein